MDALFGDGFSPPSWGDFSDSEMGFDRIQAK
jgi:hypothetical protein